MPTAHPALHVCTYGGKLVDRAGWVPDNPWDHHWGRDFPPIGCSRLRCGECGVLVASRLGLELEEGARVAPATLADAEDWGEVAGVRPEPSATGRLYACRCRVRQVYGTEDLEPPVDGPGYGQMPWRCEGHPTLDTGDAWGGQRWDLDADLVTPIAKLLRRAPEDPALAPYPDHPAARLYHNVVAVHRDRVSLAVAAHLLSEDEVLALAAARFFGAERLAVGAERLLETASDRAGFLQALNQPSHPRHARAAAVVEALAWRVGHGEERSPIPYTPAVALLREAVQAGFFDPLPMLARSDADWLVANTPDVLRRADPESLASFGRAAPLTPPGVLSAVVASATRSPGVDAEALRRVLEPHLGRARTAALLRAG